MRVSGHRVFSAGIAGATISKRRFASDFGNGDVDRGRHPGRRAPGRCRHHVLLAGLRSRLLPAGTDGAAAQAEGTPAVSQGRGALKETNAKPQGPLIIAVSIEQQKVRVYDTNGLFAESPVSTGMKGHSTPMGVFSIIQKHKMHRSNIYSGAPMPYMQRITWSGVAMHAGVLPGYPASHGCIRMPTAFAMKMWNWTRMGARVIITPGQITPASFSHPLLVAQKVVPQPLIANDPATDAPAVKSDKGADAGHATKPCEFGAGPGSPIDRRSRGAVARTDPHRGCQQRAAGDQRRRDHVRCDAVCSQDSACQRYIERGSKGGRTEIRAGSQCG